MNRKSIAFLVTLLTGVIALALMTGGRQLLANPQAPMIAPSLISYQGFLTDSSGNPLADGAYPMRFGLYSATTGGTKVWEETHSSVAVSNGFFAVLLGSGSCATGCPLGAEDFSSATRYLQASVNTGGGFLDFPRQQLASVPYALQAQEAAVAPWSGLTGVPAGFADGVDNDTLGALACSNGQVAKRSGSAWICAADEAGGNYQNVINVAKSGGEFTSVAAALNSITSSSATNRYLVRVFAGEYLETDLVRVKEYVHLQGAGANATVIRSTRTAATPGPNAATVQLDDNSRISNLTVINGGTGSYGIAIYSAETGRDTVVDNVLANANGSGGVGHYAAYLNDAEITIQNSTLRASGATGFGTSVNAALGSVNISGGFPEALIMNSTLIGGVNNRENCTDNTGTGFGLQLSNSSPRIRDSYICGGHRAISLATNGNALVQNSSVQVSSTGSAFLFEITAAGSISVANSGLSYVGNKFTGAGTGLRCVHVYNLGNWQALSNGTTAAAACN